jgi:hypothetical protein
LSTKAASGFLAIGLLESDLEAFEVELLVQFFGEVKLGTFIILPWVELKARL